MPLVRVSGNLNIYGNQGNFETDPSTWGFSGASHCTITRDGTQQTKNLYSCKAVSLLDEFAFGTLIIARAKAPAIEIGKTYQIVAKVRTNNANQIASDDCELTFENSIIPFLSYEVRRSIDDIKDEWLEVEGRFEASAIAGPTTEFILSVFQNTGVSPVIGGELWVDEFEIYEYIMTEDPPSEDPDFDTVYFSKNPIPFAKAAPEGWDALDNFRLYNDTRVEEVAGSSEFTSKLKARLYPDSDGNVVFNARAAFRDLLTAIPPEINETEIVRLTDRIKFFKHFSGQLEDDQTIPAEEDLTASSALLVLLGGISKQKYPGLNYFTEYLPANKKFLTWAPTTKYVDRLQEDYLNFWIYNGDISTLQLQVKAYFDDATDETAVIKTLEGVAYGQLYQVPAGPANCGALLINPAKNVLYYELSLLNQDDALISEVRTFIVAQVRHPLTRFFMFLNSLGASEVLMFTGKAERSTNLERDIVQKFLPVDYEAIDGEFDVNQSTIQARSSFSSGYIKGAFAKQWNEYMIDFVKSAIIYDVTTGERLRRIVTTTNVPGEADQEYSRFVRFEAMDNYIDENFTPDDI